MNTPKKCRILAPNYSRKMPQNNKNKQIDDQVGSTDESKEHRTIKKICKNPIKIVVATDSFNNVENRILIEDQLVISSHSAANKQTKTEKQTRKDDSSPEITENSPEESEGNFSEVNIDTSSCELKLRITENDSDTSEDISEISSAKQKAVATIKTFEAVLIKNEHHEPIDNATKIPDSKDKRGSTEVGELPSTVHTVPRNTSSVVSSKTASTVVSPPSTGNRVYIIKNLAGKSVTLIPKTTPVVLNKDPSAAGSVNKNKSVLLNIYKDGTRTVNALNASKNNKTVALKQDAQSQCKNLIQKLPNTGYMNIADLNKSQKYFSPAKTEKSEPLPRVLYTEVPKQCKPQVIDLTEDDMQKNELNTMPNFSKILHALTDSPAKSSGSKNVLKDIKIPIYVDCQTQTEKAVKNIGVQTEVYMPSPTSSIEELPNITNLLEYVLSNPEYNSGLDDVKKSDLIDMSKNIAVKDKTMPQGSNSEIDLKKQFFLDLKDCATFDFLGHKPIHNAVLENNLGFLKRQIFALRLRKITIDIENNSGLTALQLAISNNCNIEIISTLLGNGASPNILDNEGNNLIHLVVINSTHFVLEILLKYLVDPVKEINQKNDEGLTPLMIASIDSKPEMVDMLLRNRADPNLRDDKSGRTALFHAVELNCNFVINLLLKYKADPKVRNYFGLTALDAAKDLDISDSKILETEKEANFLKNHTSVIVNMNNASLSKNSKNVEKPAQNAGNKRGTKQNGADKGATKKSKLSFVPALMKVEISEVKNASATRRRKK